MVLVSQSDQRRPVRSRFEDTSEGLKHINMAKLNKYSIDCRSVLCVKEEINKSQSPQQLRKVQNELEIKAKGLIYLSPNIPATTYSIDKTILDIHVASTK